MNIMATQHHKSNSIRTNFLETFKNLTLRIWQLLRGAVALLTLTAFGNHVLMQTNHATHLIADYESSGISISITWQFLCRVLPPPICTIILCVIGGIMVYAVLKEICTEEWVQEPVQVEECWKEVKWYNPFS